MDPFWLYPRRRLLFGTRRLLLWRLLCVCCMLFQSVASVNAQSESVPVTFTLQEPECSYGIRVIRGGFNFGSWQPEAGGAAGSVSIDVPNGEITPTNMTSVTSGEQATLPAEFVVTSAGCSRVCRVSVSSRDSDDSDSSHLTHGNNTIDFRFIAAFKFPGESLISDIGEYRNLWDFQSAIPLTNGDYTFWIGGKISEIDSGTEPGRYTGTIRVSAACN